MCRIISDFHDYYDSVQNIAQDREKIYLRKIVEKEINLDLPFVYSTHYNAELDATGHIIGFCGKIFPALKIKEGKRAKISFEPTICFSLSDVDKLVEGHYRNRQIEDYYSEKYKRRNWSYPSHREFKKYFAEWELNKSKLNSLFLEHNAPIFILHQEKLRTQLLELNAQLKEWDFMKIFDPFQAFQELYMHFNNLAQPNKPIPFIDDKTMSEIKGFDRFSFRKDKKT